MIRVAAAVVVVLAIAPASADARIKESRWLKGCPHYRVLPRARGVVNR